MANLSSEQSGSNTLNRTMSSRGAFEESNVYNILHIQPLKEIGNREAWVVAMLVLVATRIGRSITRELPDRNEFVNRHRDNRCSWGTN